MRARFPVYPVDTTDAPIRHWAAALMLAAAASWAAIFAAARMIADLV